MPYNKGKTAFWSNLLRRRDKIWGDFGSTNKQVKFYQTFSVHQALLPVTTAKCHDLKLEKGRKVTFVGEAKNPRFFNRVT